jgi:hypothetical protein
MYRRRRDRGRLAVGPDAGVVRAPWRPGDAPVLCRAAARAPARPRSGEVRGSSRETDREERRSPLPPGDSGGRSGASLPRCRQRGRRRRGTRTRGGPSVRPARPPGPPPRLPRHQPHEAGGRGRSSRRAQQLRRAGAMRLNTRRPRAGDRDMNSKITSVHGGRRVGVSASAW